MRRSPEALIARLRNRKRRVLNYGVLTLICLGLLLADWSVTAKAIAALAPGEGDDPSTLFVVGQQMLVGIAFMQTMALLLALAFGAAVAALILELVGYTRDDLLVNPWDRVQLHEQRIAALAETQQTGRPPAAD